MQSTLAKIKTNKNKNILKFIFYTKILVKSIFLPKKMIKFLLFIKN